MACYHPIPAYQGGPGEPVKLWPPVGTATLELPCGTCLGCRTDHATEWAHRAEMEATAWPYNCFLTLTYDDDHLPEEGHLRPRDLRNFLKKLWRASNRLEPTIQAITQTRWHLARLRKGHQGPRQLKQIQISPLRYLAAGEYGDRTGRPHFHILLFNCDFADKKKTAKDLYESATVTKYWRKGGHKIGALTGASANYVAQYSLKKLRSPEVPRHDSQGEVYHPPFIRMSLKPPIGEAWTIKYKTDLQHGYIIKNARKKRIPRATKKQLAKIDPQLAELATYQAQQHKRGPHNLEAAEIIHHSKNKLFHTRTL